MGNSSKPTIYDIAKKAGVSRQTVSRVINNRPDVADETRLRVQQVIKELDYHPNAIAQSLSRQKSYIIGIVTAGLKYIGPSRTLNGIASKAESLGYGLLVKELDRFDDSNFDALLSWFQAHAVDGIIWAAPEIGSNRKEIAGILPDMDLPIIFLTMEKRDGLAIVTIDNYFGAKLAASHLVSQGRRNIGHISGPLDWWEARQRKSGWESALDEAELNCSERMWTEGNWSSKSGKTAFLALLEKYPQMDGLFVGNDQMALAVLSEAVRLGIRVPEDLAVVGFDGIEESEFFYPPLSTISQDQLKLGGLAVEELVAVMNQGAQAPSREPNYIAVKPELVVRKSSLGR